MLKNAKPWLQIGDGQRPVRRRDGVGPNRQMEGDGRHFYCAIMGGSKN